MEGGGINSPSVERKGEGYLGMQIRKLMNEAREYYESHVWKA